MQVQTRRHGVARYSAGVIIPASLDSVDFSILSKVVDVVIERLEPMLCPEAGTVEPWLLNDWVDA